MPQATTTQQGMVKEGFILAGEATHTHSSTVNLLDCHKPALCIVA
jgi:hypothetical protein